MKINHKILSHVANNMKYEKNIYNFSISLNTYLDYKRIRRMLCQCYVVCHCSNVFHYWMLWTRVSQFSQGMLTRPSDAALPMQALSASWEEEQASLQALSASWEDEQASLQALSASC